VSGELRLVIATFSRAKQREIADILVA